MNDAELLRLDPNRLRPKRNARKRIEVDMPSAGAGRQRHRDHEMTLREVVEKYRSIAGSFGKEAPLAAFGLSSAETENLFNVFDEDYHISRFFHFSESTGERLSINGFPATHILIDAEIETIL